MARCEAGLDVKVVIHTAYRAAFPSAEYLEAALHCSSGASFVLEFEIRPPEIQWELSSEHRRYMLKEIDGHDIFIYAEDDIDVTVKHISAYIEETRWLEESPGVDAERYMIGFMRYESAMVSPRNCYLCTLANNGFERQPQLPARGDLEPGTGGSLE